MSSQPQRADDRSRDQAADGAPGEKPVRHIKTPNGATSRVYRCLVAACGGVVSDRYLMAAAGGDEVCVTHAIVRLRRNGVRVIRAGHVGYQICGGGEGFQPLTVPVPSPAVAPIALHAAQHEGISQ